MRPVKVVVPISGGKDSQACLKLALEDYAPDVVRGLFCDTQFEHPITYIHVRETMQKLYGVRVDEVCEGSVLGKSEKYGRFPGGGARHCTDELKIVPTKKYCKALAEQQGGFEVWYGMRLGESPERATRYKDKIDTGLYLPHEVIRHKYPKYLGKMGVRFRLPVLNWSGLHVLDYLAGTENPLYAAGFSRIGCFPCLAGGDAAKEKAFAYDEFGAQQKARVYVVSAKIGKNIFTSKGGIARNQDSPGCAVCDI